MNKQTWFSQGKTKQKRLIRAMKFFLLFAFLTVGSCFASETYSQEASFSINYNNKTVKEVINEIENSSEFIFFYLDKSIDLNRKVSINVENKKIDTILNQLFSGTENNYSISDRQIIISKKEVPVNTETNQKDTRTISGTIRDNMGPVTGANILVKGTTNGTITDLDGKFTLENVPANAILQVSYIGYLPQEIEINNQTLFNIVLEEDNQALDEVVVVGYGTVRKADLAGSVSVLDSKSFKDQPIKQVSDALQGRVSGVQVQNSGVPGGTVKIRVRGSGSINRSNDPLYVIDGIVRESGLTGLNPEDIQSMQILKDASSTAIYGSRGANGVVMITTKRGRTGDTVLEYNGYVGVSSLRKKLDLLGKDDYIAMVNEVSQNDGNGIAITPEQAALLPNNDWQDLAYQTALTHSHQVSVSGGTDKTKLYSSLNYMNQEGIIKGSDYNRFALRINGDQKLARNLSLNASIAYSYGTQNTANSNADGWGAIAYTAMVMAPIQEIRDADGKYTNFSGTPWGGTNPVGMAELYKNKTVNSRLLANMSLIYEIIDGLTFRVNAGAEVNAGSSDRYIPIGLSAGGKLDGDASKSKSNYYTIINENILTYDKRFNKNHALNLMGGVTFQTYQYNDLGGSGTGFLRDVYETNNLG